MEPHDPRCNIVTGVYSEELARERNFLYIRDTTIANLIDATKDTNARIERMSGRRPSVMQRFLASIFG
jgi:hypothetical protein